MSPLAETHLAHIPHTSEHQGLEGVLGIATVGIGGVILLLGELIGSLAKNLLPSGHGSSHGGGGLDIGAFFATFAGSGEGGSGEGGSSSGGSHGAAHH